MKLKRALSIALCLLIFISSCIITASAVGQQGYINDTGVRLRSAATTASNQVYKFTVLNTKVNVLETVSGQEAETGQGTTWYKVSTLDGAYTGYVYGRYVTLIPLPEEPPAVAPNLDFESQLAQFPESYHAALIALHEKHPSWNFIANKTTMSFDVAVYSQYKDVRKMVELSQGIAWRSLQEGQYNWETGDWKILDSNRWVAASREVISHYMDPRNFLDETNIYMFMSQKYDSVYQNEQALSNVLKGTFLANNYIPNTADPVDNLYGGSYSKVIMAAAEKSGVSPYVIAAKIITEQGLSGTSPLISGTYTDFGGYYNFFNWGAYGETETAVIVAGLTRAKEKGWDSRADSIIDGAKDLANGYMDVKQDTYYYMDFNVLNPDKLWHQYAGSAYDAFVKGKNLAKAYKDTYDSAPLVFNIPVFTSMPDTPQALPAVDDNRYNNYYIKDMQVEGLSPKFNMYTYTYNLTISGDTTIYLTLPEGAKLASSNANWISSGYNTITVKIESQTGYFNSYTLNVQSPANCTLTVTTDPPSGTNPDPEPPVDPEPPIPQYQKGDTNGDLSINIADLANIQKHLLCIIELKGENFSAADTNGDGVLDIVDLANVQKHLLGIIVLP